jgi:trimeric autotransporter adhesin
MDQHSKRQRTGASAAVSLAAAAADAVATSPAARVAPIARPGKRQQQTRAPAPSPPPLPAADAAADAPPPPPPPARRGSNAQPSRPPPAAAAATTTTTPTTPTTLGPGVQASLPEFRAAAVPYLVGRLVDARSTEAATLALRPSLARLSSEVARVLGESASLGHNASLLVVGDAGGGKTLAVERAVAAVCARHNAGLPLDNPAVGVVRLSGALHGDERGAMAEIARQLCDAFGVTGAAASAAAAANTTTTAAAGGGAAGGGTATAASSAMPAADAAAAHMFARAASFGDNLAFLAELLSRLQQALKAVVFVLDEAEAYVRAPQRQVVLYNLLDALQRSGVRAAVVAVTSHWDLVEGMEKRVRSRFESRTLVVSPLAAPAEAERAEKEAREARTKAEKAAARAAGGGGGGAGAGAAGAAAAAPSRRGKSAATAAANNSNDNDAQAASAASAAASAEAAAAAEDAEAAARDARDETPSALLRAVLSLPDHFEPRHHAATHNASVRRALDAEPVRRALAEAADAGATPRDVAALAVAALVRAAGRASSGAAMVDGSDVLAAVRAAREAQDGRATAVTALSVLECALLAAAARVEERALAGAQAGSAAAGSAAAGVGSSVGGAAASAAAASSSSLPVVNFEAVYDEFARATLRGSEFDHLRSKPAAWRAFRDLVAAGLIEFCGGGAAGGGGAGAAAAAAAAAGAGGGGGPHALTLPYAPVQLLLHRKDLEQGLARHQLCPAWLKRYLEGV